MGVPRFSEIFIIANSVLWMGALGFEPDSWVSIPMGFEPDSWVARGFDPGLPSDPDYCPQGVKGCGADGPGFRSRMMMGFDPAESLGCRTQRMLCFDPW